MVVDGYRDITPWEYRWLIIDSFCVVSSPMIVNYLSKSMDPDEFEILIQDVYEACIDLIGADPNNYNLDELFWYVLAKKVKLYFVSETSKSLS